MIWFLSATLIRLTAAVIIHWEIGSIRMEPLWKVILTIKAETFQNSLPEVERKAL